MIQNVIFCFDKANEVLVEQLTLPTIPLEEIKEMLQVECDLGDPEMLDGAIKLNTCQLERLKPYIKEFNIEKNDYFFGRVYT